MRILLINQFFWPDSSATSQLLTDLARGLAAEGHTIYTISSGGGYNVASADAAPAAQMYRTPAAKFSKGKVTRLLSYLSFYASAAVKAMTLPRPDVVVTLTTPPLISLVGTALKQMRGSRHFIWEMDVYPDVATGLDYFRAGGAIDRVTGVLADYSRRRADGIIALGECMKDRLTGHGVQPERIFVADNWADGAAIQPQTRPGDPRELVLLYSGNLGLAHDVETLAGAMVELRDDARFRFVFVGSGGRREELAALVAERGLGSVELRPYVERGSLGESLAVGDIGLVTQRDVCLGAVVPSKVYGIMAAGRPLLFIGPQKSQAARIVARFACGWQVDCGDVAGLTSLLRRLAEHPEEVRAAGARARQAFLDYFDLPLGVRRIVKILGAAGEPPYAVSNAQPSAAR